MCGDRAEMKESGKHRSSPKSGHSAITAPRAQVAKIKITESRIKDILTHFGGTDDGAGGGISDRIDNITTMTELLEKHITVLPRTSGGGKVQITTKEDRQNLAPTGEALLETQPAIPMRPPSVPKVKTKYIPMNLEDIYSVPFTKYFKVHFQEDLKSTVNPYDIITNIYTLTGSRPKKITSENRRSFTIEVTNENLSEKILGLKKVNDIPCATTIHPRFNFARGLIYIQDFDIENLDEFKTSISI